LPSSSLGRADPGPAGAARLGGTRLSLLLLARKRTARIDILPPYDIAAGLKRFCTGELDLFASPRPMLETEIGACSDTGNAFIELPLAHAGIAVLVNYANVWAEPVDIATLLRAIGDTQTLPAKRWKELGAYWPDEPLRVYVPREVRGLNEFFDELLLENVAKALNSDFGVRRERAEVLAAVRDDPNAIALLPIRYYLEQQSRLPQLTQGARLAPPSGIVVRPSEQSVASGYYSPLSQLLVLYVSARVATQPDVADFVTTVLQEGPALSSEPIFLPLPAEQYQQALSKFHALRFGPTLPRSPYHRATVADLLEGIPKPMSPTR
jgi:phosphate transport system substrate-binding protein